MPTNWTSEEHPQHRVRVTMVTAPDGGRFRVTRVGAGSGVPVVLVPGMFDNRRLYLWPGGGGLAEMLAAAGFDPWIVERRATGGVAVPDGVRAGWDEAMRVDLPAVQELVAAETGRAAFWLGHSFGGVALARAVAETMQRSQVAGLVLVNAAVDIPLLANPLVTATVRARIWRGVFPARLLRLGPEDEPVAAFEDAISWGAAERTRGLLSATLGAVDMPVLALTAPRDVLTPAARCARLAQSFTGPDRRVQSAARRYGFARNHAHESPLLHPAAATDVFPFVCDWLTTRGGEPTPAEDAPPSRRVVIGCTMRSRSTPRPSESSSSSPAAGQNSGRCARAGCATPWTPPSPRACARSARSECWASGRSRKKSSPAGHPG